MEEIKVGEYVRTKLGNIAKVVAVKDTVVWTDDFIDVHCRYNEGIIEKTDIVKHSPNIIDLIEVGDYVNGEKVSNVDKYDNIYTIEWEYGNVYTTEIINDKFIKDIVTKEQFNQVKYEV